MGGPLSPDDASTKPMGLCQEEEGLTGVEGSNVSQPCAVHPPDTVLEPEEASGESGN